uniref:Uncharacterized protein n=1 Tax=Anguilla anguilla TaxID=7936 RepID=A0A0E9SGX5_ANGAN
MDRWNLFTSGPVQPLWTCEDLCLKRLSRLCITFFSFLLSQEVNNSKSETKTYNLFHDLHCWGKSM